MSSFRIDPLDPNTGELAGPPIITARTVVRQRALDRIGSWQFDLSVIDQALGELAGKDFNFYWQHSGETFFLGRGSYLNRQIEVNGRTVNVNAAGGLRDLKRQTVLQRSFEGDTDDVNDVLAEIVPLRAGWSLGAVDTITTPAPLDFWYEDIFDSVALLANTFGLHFREGNAPKTLDFGAFGVDSGVQAIGGDELELSPDLAINPKICIIQDLGVDYQSDRVVNRLIPFGGAVGIATIDLSETTSTQAGYPVQSAALPGAGSYYYLEDTASIAQWGLTEVRFLRKDLRPISNSPASREYAANVLYEATLASLLNLKDEQTVYNLTVTNWTPGLVKPGDKIRVRFKGIAYNQTGDAIWLDIDDTSQPGQGKAFYILEISEEFGDGVRATLKINENAVHEQTVEDLLANTIRQFEQSQIHVQPTISRYTVGPYTKRVSASPAVSANFSFKLGLETLTIWYVKIQITGEPLKASVTGAASGGGSSQTSSSGGGSTQTSSSGGGSSQTSQSDAHTHDLQVVNLPSGGSPVYFTPSVLLCHGVSGAIFTQSDSHNHSVSIPSHTHQVYIPNHTHQVTIPSHTHPLSYGIYQDTVRPDTLTIRVNGTIVASGVSLNSGNNYTYELDITSQILAAANLQQEHTINVVCGSGRGEIQFQAQVLAVIQGIQV